MSTGSCCPNGITVRRSPCKFRQNLTNLIRAFAGKNGFTEGWGGTMDRHRLEMGGSTLRLNLPEIVQRSSMCQETGSRR